MSDSYSCLFTFWSYHPYLLLNYLIASYTCLCYFFLECKCMLVSRLRSRGVQRLRLMLYNNLLEQVAEHKYLGVTLTSNLSWSTYISSISSKVRKLVGMHFYPWSSSETLHKLYIALIHPHLEYAVPVWSPHHCKDVNLSQYKSLLLECVQRTENSVHAGSTQV